MISKEREREYGEGAREIERGRGRGKELGEGARGVSGREGED